MTDNKELLGTLKIGEPHPSAHDAYRYVKRFICSIDYLTYQEAIASTALSGNRAAEICYETLKRVIENKPISDRYLLGLAWFIKQLKENKYVKQKRT